MECVRASPRFKRQATPLPEESIARNFIISQKLEVLQQTDAWKGGAGPYWLE